tara:strand:+ start:471 stop:710 length:240 start_codon:yes stop_codon:yes gene_type:complete
MTTKLEKMAAFKAQYPTLKVGSEETGYTELNAKDYEAKIAEWAEHELAKEAEELAAAQEKQTILDKLGLTENDLKALGL